MRKPLVVAVVPARAGSKGIRGKNVLPVGGRPLIAHTILAARRARGVDRVVVTTDSRRIRSVALRYGAMAPFLRPGSLARDETPGIDPVLHAVEWLQRHLGWQISTVVLLQPTSPLRTAGDIDAALAKLRRTGAPAVVSVAPAREHPRWMKKVRKGVLHAFLPGSAPAVRQKLPPLVRLNGAIYAIRREVLIRRKTLCPAGARPFMMPPERSIDIDTQFDVRIASLLLRERKSP